MLGPPLCVMIPGILQQAANRESMNMEAVIVTRNAWIVFGGCFSGTIPVNTSLPIYNNTTIANNPFWLSQPELIMFTDLGIGIHSFVHLSYSNTDRAYILQ